MTKSTEPEAEGNLGESPPSEPSAKDSIYIPPPRKSKWEEPWFRWSVLGVAGLLVLTAVGVAVLFSRPNAESDYLEVYITDVPGDFSKLKLRLGGVYVDEEGHPLDLVVSEFDLLAYTGTENSLRVAAGKVPHGTHTSITIVFSSAEGLLGETWLPIQVPKKQLVVQTGEDFGTSRAGAILLDIDPDASLILTDQGFVFAPWVSNLYTQPFDEDGSGDPDDPPVDLSNNGFKRPPWGDFDQHIDDDEDDDDGGDGNDGGDDPTTSELCLQECDVTTTTTSSSSQTDPGLLPDPGLGEGNCDDETLSPGEPGSDHGEDPVDEATATAEHELNNIRAEIEKLCKLLADIPDIANEEAEWIVQLAQENASAVEDDLPRQPTNVPFMNPIRIFDDQALMQTDLADTQRGIALKYNADYMFPFQSRNAFAVKMTPLEAWDLAQDPTVRYVELVRDVKLHSLPSAKLGTGWTALTGANAAGYPPANAAHLGDGVAIAMIDTGVDGNHPDLPYDLDAIRNPATEVVYENFKMESIVPLPVPNSDSAYGHGTHVAGIMVGKCQPQFLGVNTATQTVGASTGLACGLAPKAKLYAWGAGEYSTMLWTAQAMDDFNYLLKNDLFDVPVAVLQNSWSTGIAYDPNSLITRLTNDIVDQGVVVVFSAGNSGGTGAVNQVSGQCRAPREGVICVAGFNDDNSGETNGNIYISSSRGAIDNPSTWPDISAHATRIVSTKPLVATMGTDDLLYSEMSGTSVAAPIVSACVALMREANPSLTPAEAEWVIEETATKFANGGAYAVSSDYRYDGSHYAKGHGLLNCKAAVELAATV